MIKKGDTVSFDNEGKTLTGVVAKVFPEVGAAVIDVDDILFKTKIEQLIPVSAETEDKELEPGVKRFNHNDIKHAIYRHTELNAINNPSPQSDITFHFRMCVLAAYLGSDLINTYFDNGETIDISALNLADQIMEICKPSRVDKYLSEMPNIKYTVSECAVIALGTAQMLFEIIPELFPNDNADV